MRLIEHLLRIAAALGVLVLVWTVLFGGSAVEQHFLNPAHAAPAAGAHPYHMRHSIVYVSDVELLFLRGFWFVLPPFAIFLVWMTFSGLAKRRRASWQA